MRFDKKPSKIFSLIKEALPILVVASMLGQCVSNANHTNKLEQIAARNIPVQVGQDRQILMGKRISEVENREQFIIEIISSFSWVKRTDSNFQEACKAITRKMKNLSQFKQCESGIDPGVMTSYGKLPSSVYAYQHLIDPASKDEIIGWVKNFKPLDFDSSKSNDSRKMKVSKIGVSEKFKEPGRPDENRVPVEIEFSEEKGSIETKKFSLYYWIHTRNFIKPTANGPKNPYSLAVEASQQRGLYLTRILPYTNSSF
jgi:hypothetical protein